LKSDTCPPCSWERPIHGKICRMSRKSRREGVSTRTRVRWVFFCALLAALSLPLPLPAVENPLQSVFVLHSYHRGYRWTDDQNAGIEAVLRNAVGPNQIYIEYMDTGRMRHDKVFETLYRAFKLKYRGLKVDVVCVTDADAFRFMLNYRDKLFPGTPVVFSGISYAEDSNIRDGRNFTGVTVEADLRANMELILRLHPTTKLLVFINEWTTKGYHLHEELMRIYPLFEKAVKLRFLEDVDTKEIFDVIGSLPQDSVILYGVFGRDKVGRVFDYDELIPLLSRNTKAPIYSPWDFNLRQGIVGGVMTTGYSQGEMAGKQALSILRGGRVKYIPVLRTSPKQYMFDYDQLKRFAIEPSQLPKESIIANYPETLYQKHKEFINTGIAIIAFLLVIISVLLINIRARKRTEQELKASREKLRTLAWRLAETEDKERKRLSRELHDQVGQNMTILGVNLNLLRSFIPKDAVEMIHLRISDSLTVVKQTTERIRNLMNNLRSPVLDDYGLVAAIDVYGKQCADRTGIDIEVRGAGMNTRLNPHTENALFRIVQESLTNVVKHAKATEVVITVTMDDGTLRLSVEDNGVGLDKDRLMELGGERGWGLVTMSERALAVGGTCRLQSSPGLGTHVIVEVPV
jgi:signal transduction histidine kinase